MAKSAQLLVVQEQDHDPFPRTSHRRLCAVVCASDPRETEIGTSMGLAGHPA